MVNEQFSSISNELNGKTTHQSDANSTKKNFFVIAFAFVLVFTSYNGIINLQSSINSDKNVGLYSLAINSACCIFSCLFLTNPLMFLAGYKWTMFVSQIVFLLFIAINIYPKAWIMYLVSALCGVFRAALSTAQCSYIAALGRSDANNNNGDTKSTVNKYFAVFCSALQSSQIWGNLITYIFLQSNTGDFIPKNVDLCGANYSDSEQNSFTHNNNHISNEIISNLYITFIVLIMISLILVATMLDQKWHVKKSNSKGLIYESLEFITITLKQMKNPKQLLLLPLPFWVGTAEAFLFGIFTDSFITCSVGVQYVGLVMIAFGVTACIFSIVVGYAVKFEKRLQWFLWSFCLYYALLFIMLVWKPLPSQIYVLYVLVSLSGVTSAIWGSIIPALHGYLFPTEEEAAFSNMILSQNTGNLIVFLYGGLLRVRTSIILEIIYLTVAMMCYLILESLDRGQEKSETSPIIPAKIPVHENE